MADAVSTLLVRLATVADLVLGVDLVVPVLVRLATVADLVLGADLAGWSQKNP